MALLIDGRSMDRADLPVKGILTASQTFLDRGLVMAIIIMAHEIVKGGFKNDG